MSEVVHVSTGGSADPWPWWCRWGMPAPEVYGIDWDDRCGGIRFRCPGGLTREQRAGLHEDGRFRHVGAGWWEWLPPRG